MLDEHAEKALTNNYARKQIFRHVDTETRCMNSLTHILGVILLTAGLLLPTNGCASNNSSSIKKFDCSTSKSIKIIIPATPNITMKSTRCVDYVFASDKMRKVIHMFVEDYSSEFDISEPAIWSMLSGLEIEVSAIPRVVKSAFDVNGKPVKNAHVTGLALSDSHIWVEVKTSQIWTSSLAHELVHIIIWKQNAGIHGDPDHEGNQFSGWQKKHTKFIKQFNRDLFDNNL